MEFSWIHWMVFLRNVLLTMQETSIDGTFGTATYTFDHKKLYRLQDELLQKLVKLGSKKPPPNDIRLGLETIVENVLDVDEKLNTMRTRLKRRVSWYDSRVQKFWPKEEGLPYMWLDRHLLWKPKVPVRNLANEVFVVFSGMAFAQPTGRMETFDSIIIETGCTVDLQEFPFDVQRCKIISNPVSGPDDIWEFKNESLLISRVAGTGYFVNNAKWRILRVVQERRVNNADTVILVNRFLANPFFFLVLPAVVITMVAQLQFALPIDGGERVGLGVTCMLTMVVFMTILDDKFSPDENRIPHLALFFGLLMILITFVTALGVLTIQLYNMGAKKRPPICLCRLAACMTRLLCRVQSRRTLLAYSRRHQVNVQKVERSVEGDLILARKKESDEEVEHIWKIIAITIDNYACFTTTVIFIFLCLEFLVPFGAAAQRSHGLSWTH